MLKNIPPILSPQLLKVLMEMGHGDEILLADGNFPAESMGKNAQVIRADGHGAVELLQAILTLLPLDTYVVCPAALMAVGQGEATPPIWERFYDLLRQYSPQHCQMEQVERFDFYQRSRQAYAIVATGETALYANILLRKGVVT